MPNLTKLIVESYLAELHESFSYPKSVKEFNYDTDLKVFLNNSVWDIEHGTILKITGKNTVSHALFGFESLNQFELKQIYGNPPVFEPLEFPDKTR
jgi:hypothetical protein